MSLIAVALRIAGDKLCFVCPSSPGAVCWHNFLFPDTKGSLVSVPSAFLSRRRGAAPSVPSGRGFTYNQLGRRRFDGDEIDGKLEDPARGLVSAILCSLLKPDFGACDASSLCFLARPTCQVSTQRVHKRRNRLWIEGSPTRILVNKPEIEACKTPRPKHEGGRRPSRNPSSGGAGGHRDPTQGDDLSRSGKENATFPGYKLARSGGELRTGTDLA